MVTLARLHARGSLDDEDRVFPAEAVLLLQEGVRIGNPLLSVKEESVAIAAWEERDSDFPPLAPFFETLGSRGPVVEVAAEANRFSVPCKRKKNQSLRLFEGERPCVPGAARRGAEREKEEHPAARATTAKPVKSDE